jgi:hypothetical protein
MMSGRFDFAVAQTEGALEINPSDAEGFPARGAQWIAGARGGEFAQDHGRGHRSRLARSAETLPFRGPRRTKQTLLKTLELLHAAQFDGVHEPGCVGEAKLLRKRYRLHGGDARIDSLTIGSKSSMAAIGI